MMLNHPDFKPYHSYSQDGEDMILRSLLAESIPNFNDYRGFYIDIGAHHPYRFSNTMHFYELGWQGINIEPTPAAMQLFEQYRKRDVNLNIGIGEQPGKLTLYCFNESALNSFDKALSESRDQEDTPYHIVSTAEVEVRPLAQVLDQYLPADIVINFMSVDVSGLDVDVLQSNNWDKYRPRFVLAEDADINFSYLDASEAHSFLAEQGYEVAGKTLRTLIFKQKR
ncbi:FkbM family methyltransferase [Mucilaginibacter robiniae]|uniref:FkbM family methyltransferase n=2 Tax=Mucilaginibacter robiniae TaxID=2728022 RepID=A0A7L5EBJ3_9SPHI|nr:FkbM family methyltransferase [Mucilaginibacter robiniae]